MALALMALARGDGAAADRAARRAQQFLPQRALPHLLAAQAAILKMTVLPKPRRITGNCHAANADNDQRSLSGEGLYCCDSEIGEPAAAYTLQALELAPKSKWAFEMG